MGDESDMRDPGLVVGEVGRLALTVVVEGQVLVIVAEMHPAAMLAVPGAGAFLANAPVRKRRLVEAQAFCDIVDDEIDVFQL